MIKKTLAAICILAACAMAQANENNILFKDKSEIAKGKKWHVFNGNMELGEIGKPVPGYSLRCYFNPEALIKKPEQNFFPTTKADSSGNKYLETPGYIGLPEYNLNCGARFLQKDGIVELSFKAKIIPAEDGKFHPERRIILDFRCRNLKKLHGTLKERYPVLVSKTFQPEKEWKTFSFKIAAKANFVHKMMFRHYGKTPQSTLNGFCLDDLSLKYVDDKEANSSANEAALITEKLIPAYESGETVNLKINALLQGNQDAQKIRLHVRKDFFLETCQVAEVELKRDAKYKQTDERSLYSGICRLKAEPFGSFNTLAMFKGQPLFIEGGDFVTLHHMPEKVSPLQRKIGGHYRTHGSRYQLVASNDWPSVFSYGLGLDSEAKVYSLSGLRHAMYAFDLKKVQPHEKTMALSLPDVEIKLLEKYNIEPVGCLGGWWIYADRKSKRGNALVCTMPSWFYKDEFTKATGVKKDARTVKDEYWRVHVNGIVNKFGKRIAKWMLLVEPQWVLPAKEYFSLQKTAYEIVKRDNPNSLFIAGDATSDHGYNLTNWLKSLHELGFEKYLDCASFNPYGSSSDYINGVLFRYSNLLTRIQKILNPETPLWQEELYYIANSKRKQDKANQSLFSAGDAQRHYLLGLLSNLRGVTAITTGSLFKSSRTPGDVCAGLNALSYFLSDKSTVENVKHRNKLLRCGIFSDQAKQNNVGVLWALKAKGASVAPPAGTENLKVYDCFGNPLEWKTEIPLGLDPVFVKGSFKELKKFFAKSKFSMGQPIELRARTFEDKTFLEAQNKSGAQAIVTVNFEDSQPPVRLIFKESDYKRFSFDRKLANLKYKAGSQAEGGGAVIKTIAAGKEFTVPDNKAAPLSLKIQDSAKLDIWTAEGKLWIKASVKDSQISPAKDDNLYSSDALEVFIDCAPFNRLDVDEHNHKMTKGLKIKQYIFAPAPSGTGRTVLALDCGSGKRLDDSKASVKSEKTADGYTLVASIPLSEISPCPDSKKIIGMNFELCRLDGEKKLAKAVFVNPDKPSYKYRQHYPLFKIPAFQSNILKNGNCENGLSDWNSSLDSKLNKKTFSSAENAYSGKKALKVEILEEPAWGPSLKRGSVSYRGLNLKEGKYRLAFYSKGHKIDHIKINMGDASRQKILKNGDLPVAEGWTKYEMPFEIAKATDKGRIYIEFLSQRNDKDSYALLDEMSLVKTN